MCKYSFSVFTPTYNRAESIKETFESLRLQTMCNFEWIIIDDGSTDNTKEVVEGFKKMGGFPIRYVYQENQGKHVAQNAAVSMAEGELFLPLDSDDTILPTALQTMWSDWQALSDEERARYSGLGYHCQDKDGNRIGPPWPYDGIESNDLEMALKYKVSGEKYGFIRVDVMKGYDNPVVKGHRFCEDTVWYRIAKDYQKRYYNKCVRVYEVHQDSTTILGKANDYNLECKFEATLIYINEFSDWFLKYDKKRAVIQTLKCLKFGVLLKKKIILGDDALLNRVKPLYARCIILCCSPYKIVSRLKR